MNRTITPQETEELFKVCKNYGVYFYDVQIELVDHLASFIEEQWVKNPELNFQSTMKNAVSIFGKSNFTEFALQKEKEVNRKYNRLLWNYLVEFYRWPKILITIAFSLGLFILFEIFNQTEIMTLAYSGLVLFSYVIYLLLIFPKYKIAGRYGKTFLLVGRQSQINSIIILILQVPNLIHLTFNVLHIQTIENKFALAGLSFFIVFLSILLYANIFFLTKKIKEHFTEQFPEFAK